MKKFLAMALVMALVCSFAGCCCTLPFTEEIDSPQNDMQLVEGTVPTDRFVEVSRELTRGMVIGNEYYSDFNGLTFTAPSDWVFASDEEIMAAMELGIEIAYDNSAFQDAIVNMTTIFDMMATGPDGSNINIVYENLALTGNQGISDVEYAELVKSQLEANTALEYQVDDYYSTVYLCGQAFTAVRADVTYLGVEMEQIYYMCRMDDYMCSVIVTCLGDTTIADIEACFG